MNRCEDPGLATRASERHHQRMQRGHRRVVATAAARSSRRVGVGGSRAAGANAPAAFTADTRSRQLSHADIAT
jgi:hypothetical protein